MSDFTVGEHGPERFVRTDEVIGQSDGKPRSVPNQADVAWEELERLRAEARSLGLEVNERWPLAILREEVARARTKR